MANTIYEDGTYLASNPDWHIEDSPWKARQVLTMLERHKIMPGTVAEVGCGAGEILRQMSLSLPQTSFYGYDISEAAIKLARSRESDRVHFVQEDLCKTDRKFDVLIVMDVIEHVEDCFGFLRSLRDKARYKIMHIPLDMAVSLVLRDRIMDMRESVGHIHYFSKQTALALLKETGYNVIDHFYTPEYECAPKDLPHRTMALVRRMAMKVAPNSTARLLGGCPLLVLAE